MDTGMTGQDKPRTTDESGKKTLLIMAGGTGGHVYPALAVAEAWGASGHPVIWMGTRSGIEARVVPPTGIEVEWLDVSGIRGKGWRGIARAPFMLLRALWQSARILRRVKPDVVLGMGGFVSGPGGLMARLMGIPLVLHEQNRVPGTTNRWLAGMASRVLEAFPDSFPPGVKAVCTGNPLRQTIGRVQQTARKDGEACRILILGGSLGARVLNEQIPDALARLGIAVKIRHQTGAARCDETRDRYAELRLAAQVDAFIEDMAAVYAWADLVICRAGAMTVSELAAAGLPSVLIPFPYAIDDHQTLNARYFSEAGAALLLPQTELTSERLAAILESLCRDRKRLEQMGQAARNLARPDATAAVVDICMTEAEP